MAIDLWRGLLMVGAAVAASAQHAPDQPLTFEEVASYIVNGYNLLDERTSTFRILEAAAPPEWDATAEGVQQELQLTIKETVCGPHQKGPAEGCNFQDGGVEKVCSGFYTLEQTYRFILVWCNEEGKKPEPLLREQWNKFRKKLIKKFRKSKRYPTAVVSIM